MDVDSTGRVSEPSRLTQTPHQTLERIDVLPVEQHRADQLHAVFLVRLNNATLLLALAVNAAVIHKLPNPSVRGGDALGVIVVAQRAPLPVQIGCGNVSRSLSGDACELDFDAKMVGKQSDLPSFLYLCVLLEGIHGCASK